MLYEYIITIKTPIYQQILSVNGVFFVLNLKKGDIMYDFLSSFFLGIFSTAFLFLLSAALSLGAKAVYFHVKDILPKKTAEQPVKSPPKRKADKKPRQKGVVRSIEIDPEQVDRIQIRKIS